MQIVFTGATSFTGMWFVKKLAEKGHKTTSLIQRDRTLYEGLRLERLKQVEEVSTPIFNAPFGSDVFLNALENLPQIDIFCHHAADVTNYKSPDFDVAKALGSNTYNTKKVLEILSKKGCKQFILTGSVFEPDEGAGSENLRAVSPYGLSKGVTSDYFEYFVPLYKMTFRKFVIPNPFGPYEEVRFTTFLAQKWLKDEIPPVTQPSYVRDNIPVTLLADAYAYFVESHLPQMNPSYKPEIQGNFVKRFADNIKPFLNKPCQFELKVQTDFSEPVERINTDSVLNLPFDEKAFYKLLSDFYIKTYG